MQELRQGRRWAVWFGLPVIFFLCCSAANAQETGNLVGQIVLPNGSPPPQKILIVLETRGATLDSQYCDDEGRFGFYNLVPNPYHIVIRDPSYFSVDEIAVVEPTIQQTRVVHILLTPRERPPQPSPPGAASGGNPYAVNVSNVARKFPPEAEKEYRAGVKAEREGNMEEAVRHYQKAIEIAPDFYSARNNLGARYLAERKFRDAEKEFNQVIRLNADDANAYFNLGNVFYLTKRYPDAERAIQQGLKRQTNVAFGHFLLGSVYVQLRKFPEAERSLRTALQLAPQIPEEHLELVNLYLLESRTGDAIKELETFEKLFPRDPRLAKVKEVLAKLKSASPATR